MQCTDFFYCTLICIIYALVFNVISVFISSLLLPSPQVGLALTGFFKASFLCMCIIKSLRLFEPCLISQHTTHASLCKVYFCAIRLSYFSVKRKNNDIHLIVSLNCYINFFELTQQYYLYLNGRCLGFRDKEVWGTCLGMRDKEV